MRKTIMTIAAAASIPAAAIATPKPAEARCLGCWVGAGIATGVVGGALASRAYGYGYPAYDYAPTPTRGRITGATRRDVTIRAANARRIWDTAEPQAGAAAEEPHPTPTQTEIPLLSHLNSIACL
jgi:hypothetical protein